MKAQIIYAGPGCYVPQITPKGVIWKRDTEGDPQGSVNIASIYVDSILSVKKWAEIVKIEIAKEEGIPQ